jgi:two-component system response regulator RegA
MAPAKGLARWLRWGPGVSPRQRSLLIVDDDPCVRESLAQWFRDAHWSVRTATGCAQAAEMAALSTPDFLVAEQRFADGSIFDLLGRFRTLNPGIFAVVLTRAPAIAAAVHAMRVGFQDYVAKPIDPRRLASLLGAPVALDTVTPASAANDVDMFDEEPASLARVEWEHIHSVLLDCRGNISEAARVLGLHRRSLQRKLRRNGPALAAVGRNR